MLVRVGLGISSEDREASVEKATLAQHDRDLEEVVFATPTDSTIDIRRSDPSIDGRNDSI
jgi:hypothetical protein